MVKIFTFAFVKRFSSILFLLIYLYCAAEGYQFLKIQNLVEHFHEHKASDPEMSLYHFFAKHYFGSNIPDEDNSKDMQLPFKSHQECMNGNMIVIAPELTQLLVSVIKIQEIKLINYSTTFASSSFLCSIWQPPQFC